MRFFSPIYDKVLHWSQHRHAPIYLACLSFIEAAFFPIPPDVMLAPMSLAKPQKAWWFATVTTLFSVLGGLFGYLLGMFFISLVEPTIIKFGYLDTYHQVQLWFQHWGFFALFCSGMTPIPYKLFTIASGAVAMPLIPFVFGSLIGRGLRFFLVSGLMLWGGDKMKNTLRNCIDWFGWAFILLVMIALLFWQLS